MYRVWNFIANYSILLISGALIALIWANVNPSSYHHFVEFPLWFNNHVGLDYSYWAKSFGTGYAEFGGAGSLKVLSLHYLFAWEKSCNTPVRHVRRHVGPRLGLPRAGCLHGIRYL